VSVVSNRNLPFGYCKDHGFAFRKGCLACRFVQAQVNKAIAATPCECGSESEYFWQSPSDLKEFNATCSAHTPPNLILEGQR
jgi:hypothetical protein